MSPHGDKTSGNVELTHLIDIGLWQSMLDSLSARLRAGTRILNERKEVVLQSRLAGLCRESMARRGTPAVCSKCCDLTDFPSYDEGGFALCAHCDRAINFVFNLRVDSIQGYVVIGPVWIAEKGVSGAVPRLARKFGIAQAKFSQLASELVTYSLEDFREAGEMVLTTMRVVTQTLSASLELAREVGQLKESLLMEKKRTWQTMVKDELTGTLRYNFGLARLKEEVARAERYKQVLSIVVVGVGEFRSYVDRYGPSAVNSLMKAIGTVVQSKSRKTDIPVRLREEEFLLVLPFTPERGARAVLERIRQEIAAISIQTDNGAAVEVPPLLDGLASYPEDGGSERELLRKALQELRE